MLLPIIGFGIAVLLKLPPEIAVGIMILAACPGGPTSNLISHLAKGDLALSVSLTAASSLVTILTIPFIVNFALSYFLEREQLVELKVLETVGQIFLIVIIPVVLGMLIRRFNKSLANRMEKPVRIGSGVVLFLIIVGIIVKERANMISYFEQAGIAALLLNIMTMLVGYYSAKLFRIKNAQATSISIESGIQNGTLAISISVVLLGSTAFAIAPAIYSVLMFLTAGIWIFKGSRK